MGDKKTFPKIQIVGYKGPAVVVVSCVTHDSDVPKTHPHNLVSPASVGRDGCKKGVCTMNVNNEEMSVEFPHLGIQCVRRRDIADALKQRQEIRVDPFRQGFGHVDSSNSIDLNAVKLCFQVFLENPKTPGKYTVILDPVCSKPIFDAKAKKELQIMDMSDNTAPADGGKKIIILCEKVSKEDIKVRFYDYNIPQSSPDSQALADLNISSPGMSCQPDVSHSDLVNILAQAEAQDQEMQNLSDKLDEFSLGAPLNISPVTSSRAGGKRSSREAENDSASLLIPRQMERQQSSISTPNVSSNLSEILQNCKQINDLG